MTKDPYSKFKNSHLSEKAFRECWGKEYEDLIKRRDDCIRVGHTLLARNLDQRLDLLGRIFMSLEEFRVEK
jgi:hypothetical protein